jgi:hypothetical protein
LVQDTGNDSKSLKTSARHDEGVSRVPSANQQKSKMRPFLAALSIAILVAVTTPIAFAAPATSRGFKATLP